MNNNDLCYKVLGELPWTDNAGIRFKISKPLAKKNKQSTLYQNSYYEDLLRKYFRLDVNLEEKYASWTKAHEHFEKLQSDNEFIGIRMLAQDYVENLFSFICSQNNNISRYSLNFCINNVYTYSIRISGLVEKICSNYGEKICDHDGVTYYNFPNVETLAKELEVEAKLRKLGFGYRAKYIDKSAKEIMSKGGLRWFKEVEQMEYKEAHAELVTLTGIGPKVADCIALMSLNFLQSIPVDTHILQIAKVYMPYLDIKKSMTPKTYNEIGDKFRSIYGDMAGWAQTVLFCSDLRKFQKDKQPDDSRPNKKMKKIN